MSKETSVKFHWLIMYIMVMTTICLSGNTLNIYTNDKYHYSIILPEGWKLDTSAAPTQIKAESKESFPAMKMIVIIAMKLTTEQRSLGTTNLKSAHFIDPHDERYTFLSSGHTFLDGKDVFWHRFVKKAFNSYLVTHMIIGHHYDYAIGITATVYGVSADQAIQHWQSFDATFRETMASFKFTDNNELVPKGEGTTPGKTEAKGNPLLSLLPIIVIIAAIVGVVKFIKYIVNRKGISKQPDWIKRREMVWKLDDVNKLEKIAENDPDERVRDAAEDKLAELNVSHMK